MAGPVIEAVKDAMGIDDSQTVREQLDSGRPLKKHQERLSDNIEDGGCCDAAMAAEATRREGKEYR